MQIIIKYSRKVATNTDYGHTHTLVVSYGVAVKAAASLSFCLCFGKHHGALALESEAAHFTSLLAIGPSALLLSKVDVTCRRRCR